jgi:very-short-patch-repair endonuclease
MTRYEFLKKARDIHGYKYLYPKLHNRITYKDKINILYNGILYKQSISKHLLGRCPEKNTPKKTTPQFIEEARQIWGGKYDYSLVDYKGALEKIKIVYEGVVFEQSASSHLRGLSPEANMNLEWFIKKAKDKWGKDKYDYSLVDYKNCKEKVRITLKETGEIFEQTPENHLVHAPENITKRKTTEDFILSAKNIHGDKYLYDKAVYFSNKKKVTIVCPIHGDFEQTPLSHLSNKSGCKKCGDENKKREYKSKYTTEEFIYESKLKWGDKYDYSLVNYINSRTKVKIIYDDIVYDQTPVSHLKYPPERFMDQEIFLIKSKRKWGNKYDYSLVNYVSTKKFIKIIYKDVIYEQYPHNHLIYAPELRNKSTKKEFIEKSLVLHSNKYNYDKVEYENDIKKVIIICPIHGEFKQTPNIHLRGSGCKKCSDSFGEKEISKFLDKFSIKYEREYKFKECLNIYPLRFDFYIPSMRTVIEFDGIQHFQPVTHFGGVEAYERLKINDKIKEDYCEENYINIIRIRYDQIDDIYQILWENLKGFIKSNI